MAEHPAGWPWSSYPGHAHQGQRLEWVAYDELLASWGGEFGGSDAAAAYRRFVTAGLVGPGAAVGDGSPRLDPRELGVRRSGGGDDPGRSAARVAAGIPAGAGHSLERACEVVCATYGIEAADLVRRGSRHPARAALAYLARRRTAATNSELMRVLGVSPESVPNLTRRLASWLSADAGVRREYQRLEVQLDDPVPRPTASKKKLETRSDPEWSLKKLETRSDPEWSRKLGLTPNGPETRSDPEWSLEWSLNPRDPHRGPNPATAIQSCRVPKAQGNKNRRSLEVRPPAPVRRVRIGAWSTWGRELFDGPDEFVVA